MRSDNGGPALRGRRRERDVLDGVLRDVRDGRSRVLVLRGEAGAGKTALLDHLAATARGRVTRAAGAEAESEIAYSALQQLCAPLLDHLDALPRPQRDALATAFGLGVGEAPGSLLVGLAVLGLLAEAATDQPLVCVVDDVQWLDRMSEVVLTFVARRLDAESVALVCAVRSPGDERILTGLPDLRVEGLPAADARALLDSVLPGPVDDRVRDRIVAETRGNPLALLELPHGLTPAELAFGFGTPGSAPLANRLEAGFQRRIAALPADARRLLLAAAVEPVGDVALLWRAVESLDVGPDATGRIEAAGLVEFGALVRFRHPLVRSAARRSADVADLRAVHRALAEVTDPEQDPDRRAWHRAHAATGPDEDVAGDLEDSAGRALARGGRIAAAAFLERAAELTPDPKTRAARALAAARAQFDAGGLAEASELLTAAELGPLDPVRKADVERLRAQIAFSLHAAGPSLLATARRLEDLDVAAARETYLSAIGAAVRADDLREAAEAARDVPAGDDPAGLLLTALTTWALDGYPPAVPLLRTALATADPRFLWLTAPAAHAVWDAAAWHRLTERAVDDARATGTLSLLPTALVHRAEAQVIAGRFTDAAALLDEATAFARATGVPVAPSGALASYRGRPTDTSTHEEGGLLGHAGYAEAVLHNGLGDYPTALRAAGRAVEHGAALAELVEAATRTGDTDQAADARSRLADRTTAAGTDWALGVQATADALAGPPDQAEDHYREALDRLSGDHLAVPLARAHLLYGEWLRRENRRADARTHLRTAHDSFTAMGAEAFADRASRELAATGETVRKRTTDPTTTLTAQETQIVRLAAAGRTNPEIGATLFLSPRTVEWHLRKVFTKLGVTSRRELAAALRV